jgi:peptide/nickel transport system substrate-binding protein
MRRQRWAAVVVVGVAGVLGGFGVAAGKDEPARAGAGTTLYVDRAFEIKTSDPQRALEPTASIVDRAVFDTLFTFRRSDLTHPVPLLVTRWSASKDAKTFVFRLRKDVHFADGSSLTSADVVFSFRRLINLKDSPSFLLAGVDVSARGKYGVVLRSSHAYTALPSILAMTPCGIVNSRLVRRHGGTDAQNADNTDTAQPWFDSGASAGAGSGPYVLHRFTLKSPIVLNLNRRYWGRTAPAFTNVVLRNMLGIRQLVTIRRGAHQVALDLTARQAETLKHNTRLNVEQPPSTWLFWLFANSDPQVSPITSNKHFQQAVRAALDYKALVSLAGPGAIQAPGIIPSMFLGAPARSALHRNLGRARSELVASGVGDRTVTLEYPSDLTISSVSLAALARKVQAGLQAAGFHVALAGSDIGTWLARYREGKIPFGLYLSEPDFPDASDYLAFTPGDVVGLRVGWAKGSDPTVEGLAARARVTSAFKPREQLYRQLQLKLNQSGPFVPLIQPAHGFAATKDLRNAVFNQQYDIDVTQISPR